VLNFVTLVSYASQQHAELLKLTSDQNQDGQQRVNKCKIQTDVSTPFAVEPLSFRKKAIQSRKLGTLMIALYDALIWSKSTPL